MVKQQLSQEMKKELEALEALGVEVFDGTLEEEREWLRAWGVPEDKLDAKAKTVILMRLSSN